MRYSVLFELIDGKLPGLNATSSEGDRKRPESSSPEKLKARNKEKFNGSQGDSIPSQQPVAAAKKITSGKSSAKHGGTNKDEGEDNYEEEFEKLLDQDDEEEDEEKAAKKASSPKGSAEAKKQDEDDEYAEDDDYIDEEEMLDIAERCFMRIAEAIVEAGVSVRQAFQPFIIREEFEGEYLELLSPIGFLEGVKELGVTDLEEVEVACLMRVLTKADLENAILLRELIVIMDNFGIQDDEGNTAAAEGGKDDSNAKDGSPDAEDSSNKKKKKKKGAAEANQALDLSQLDEKSIKILAKLMLALMELNVSLYDFFDGAIYEQLVKTKTKQNTVEIIAAKDFFELLQRRGVRKNPAAHENLQKFLQLDPNYPHLIMIKKVAKALDEMAKNEELMEGILAAAVGADELEGGVGGGEIEQPGYDEEEFERAQNNNDGGERLGTIGEDGDEDKQIYDTNTQGGKPKKGAAGKRHDSNEDDDYEDDEDLPAVDNKRRGRPLQDNNEEDYEF